MRKMISAGLAALTAVAAIGVTSAPAMAQRWHDGGRWHDGDGWRRGGDWHGGGWRGGGFGIYFGGPYYGWGPGYYGYSCAHRVWDPYEGAWVIRYYC